MGLFSRMRQVAAVSHYNRGREMDPGAAVYSYGGDLAAGVVFPMLGTGVVNQRQYNSRTGTLRIVQLQPATTIRVNGELTTVGNITNPFPIVGVSQ